MNEDFNPILFMKRAIHGDNKALINCFMSKLIIIYKFFRKINRIVVENAYYYFHTKKSNRGINFSTCDKVIFVAHPDDEVIFFGNQLLSEPGWLVVCVTNGGNRTRLKEFIGVMESVGANYIIWNFRDGVNATWNRKRLNSMISEVLGQRVEWTRILTHNIEGEYGHYQHKQLHQSLSHVYPGDNLYFSIERCTLLENRNRLTADKQDKKRDIFKKYYKSQVLAFDVLKEYFEFEGQKRKS